MYGCVVTVVAVLDAAFPEGGWIGPVVRPRQATFEYPAHSERPLAGPMFFVADIVTLATP